MLIKWLILDAMGVIFEVGDDLNELLIPFLQKRNAKLSVELIRKLYLEASLGKFTSREFWNRLGFNKEYPMIEREYLGTCFRIDTKFFDVAKELKNHYSLALLSNDVKEWSNYLRNMFDINKFFDIVIVSGDVGFRKPDNQIFKIVLTRIDCPSKNCVFIDDNLRNIHSAAKLGFNTIRFVRKGIKTTFSTEFKVSNFIELLGVLENFK